MESNRFLEKGNILNPKEESVNSNNAGETDQSEH